MATKTISLEIDAYEKLKAAKRGRESFSEVVRRAILPKRGMTGHEILSFVRTEGPFFSESELDTMENAAESAPPPSDAWAEESEG